MKIHFIDGTVMMVFFEEFMGNHLKGKDSSGKVLFIPFNNIKYTEDSE